MLWFWFKMREDWLLAVEQLVGTGKKGKGPLCCGCTPQKKPSSEGKHMKPTCFTCCITRFASFYPNRCWNLIFSFCLFVFFFSWMPCHFLPTMWQATVVFFFPWDFWVLVWGGGVLFFPLSFTSIYFLSAERNCWNPFRRNIRSRVFSPKLIYKLRHFPIVHRRILFGL